MAVLAARRHGGGGIGGGCSALPNNAPPRDHFTALEEGTADGDAANQLEVLYKRGGCMESCNDAEPKDMSADEN